MINTYKENRVKSKYTTSWNQKIIIIQSKKAYLYIFSTTKPSSTIHPNIHSVDKQKKKKIKKKNKYKSSQLN